MISRAELDIMKQGSYLINASRGTVVDIPALIDARRSGKIAGFALDVYPNEPAKNGRKNGLREFLLADGEDGYAMMAPSEMTALLQSELATYLKERPHA